MTEDQKYQGALYKEKNKRVKTQNTPNQQRNQQSNAMVQHAYVEDVDETWKEYQGQTEDERSPAELLPEAPTPPAAVNEENINVFDFLDASQTPNASNLNLAHPSQVDESKSLVRYEYNEEYVDASGFMDDEALLRYANGPYETPAPAKSERRKKDGDAKTDKKRKRLHLEVPGDEVMTDAPPVLHSGLTGGLKSLMRPTFPPSPDYSGADVAEPSPASPLKKTKSKHSKNGQVSNSIFGMIAGSSKTKTKKRKTSKKSSSRHGEKSPKLIEYKTRSKEGKGAEGAEMVVYKPRADLFFEYVNKGPESERGCSMNKTLKRFHRERQAAGTDLTKQLEEKELWRSIRLRRNDRGEIVLFSI